MKEDLYLIIEHGLTYWDGNTNAIYDFTNSDILSNFCFELELDNDSILWIRHSSGFSRMKIDHVNQSLTEEPYTTPSPYKLYPNPTSGSFTLTNPQLDKRQIDIFTLSGELVSSATSDSVDYTTTLEAGVYWVKIGWETGQAAEKVVVLR